MASTTTRRGFSAFLLFLSIAAATTRAQFPPSETTLEHTDPTLPPVLLPGQAPPKCSLLVLHHHFSEDTLSASANYTQPPDCPSPWTRVVLDLHLSLSAADTSPQKSRVAAVWIDGAELLRTSTPLPSLTSTSWSVQKDVTRYTAAFRRLSTAGLISMMLDSSSSSAVFSANITLHFYRGAVLSLAAAGGTSPAYPTTRGLYHHPADLIIPVTKPYSSPALWFRIHNETHVAQSSPIAIPRNTYRAVLETFASYHAGDESWYTTPLRSGGGAAAGGFRQLYATIDGKYVGGHVPFPVIYPGSINPSFWSPIASIGAFDMPSYDLDVTPFLSLLLDGRPHQIALGVRGAQSYWLLSANLHLWVDEWSDATTAGLIEYTSPPVKMNNHAEWRTEEGQSEVNAEGLVRFRGWVSSSLGNLTTTVQQKLKYKSQVEVQNRGGITQVEVNSKGRVTVEVTKKNQVVGRVQMVMEAPLQVQTTRVKAAGGAVYERTRLSHQLQETEFVTEGQTVVQRQLTDRQEAEGSALMREEEVVWGSGMTKSAYKYRDEGTCYVRTVNAVGGVVVVDTKSGNCGAVGGAAAAA